MQAEALFGVDDSLVVATLRTNESLTCINLAFEASGPEKPALCQRSLAALLSILPLLLRRAEANTLLPGTIKDEELDYAAHVQVVAKKAKNKPVPSLAVLRAEASTIGYDTLVLSMFRSLRMLRLPWPAAQKRIMESFVLQGLDIIPRTAGIHASLIATEDMLVEIFEQEMKPHDYESF